ncbi:uncharacterized protein BXZ73DRAFT_103687 [Epithele typhae]|uniref:uncharacterized protein n=1 Tax=Epithele typhae TaxID=378194 RepID=UPI002007C28A|nr:uncharacterized protein BXZ73DRAFT_103687 [Epithele typhae]KAH9923954.1 hypothetical protein BXZ73DRAFT_103687 [Epithele typhae]
MTNLQSLLSLDITDATDFPDASVIPGLRQFDDAVRCSICRDFYDAPVTLNCGHCFCSAVHAHTAPLRGQCIRAALSEQATCPSCRKPGSEMHLRKDVAMGNAIDAWKLARASPELDEASEPLPKVAYDIHPQKRIVEMLAEWSLSTHGSKDALVRRHKRWVIMYNANLDRLPAARHSLDRLRDELRKQEDAETRTWRETVEDPSRITSE